MRIEIMDYRNALTPWAVFRCLPSAQNICMARFRTRRNAEEYQRILRQLTPGGNFEVVFDQVATTPTPR